ncbi:GAF domain-containing protein [Streptomyces sp. NBC_01808]|uniref:GAF domain-containing protein n=1 Tax=Streptomyces sp. NBC_01808 TaxID=2975947 RepID=UPI002DDA28BC|nr:GAF domain-containing protein [Streptomyces sp. NBC_01808]WSA39011.1 GAF domain-containing protein [Streptomyces sp. NBC_01808]
MTAADSMDAAARATRGLQGVSSELAERVTQLLAAMRSIGTGLQLHPTLDVIAQTAAELAGARYASLVVIDEQSGDLDEFASYGVDEVDRARLDAIPDAPGTTLTVPIDVDGRYFGDLVLSEKRGGGRFLDDDLHLVRIIATEAGIAIGNARLHLEARQRERWIDGAHAVTTALLSSADARDALGVIAEQARGLADAMAGVVLLPRSGGEEVGVGGRAGGAGGRGGAGRAAGPEWLEVVAVAGEGVDDLVGRVLPSYSPTVRALLAGKEVFLDDAGADPRAVSDGAERFGPCMMLPLRSGKKVLGALSLPRAPGARLYRESEKQSATQFTGQAALALMLSEVQRDRERLAVYEDRDRIARDLHDLVIQRLFATGMQLQGAKRLERAPEVRQRIDAAVDALELTIEEIRGTIYALQQEPAQAPTGMRALVLREVATAAAPLGFQPSTSFVGAVDERVDERIARQLLAALREGLSNASRHAGAGQVGVVVDATAELPDGRDAVRLTVADDGRGLPPDADGRRSGLRNIERRAEELGGQATYGPGLGDCGGGTSLIWEVPLTAPAGESGGGPGAAGAAGAAAA